MTERQERCLMAVIAHPDDETFGCGGTLARCAGEGVRVVVVCATRGEAGEISDPGLADRDSLGQVREGELRAACEAMGIRDVFVLGYRDSGMAGTPENQHPNAFAQADRAEVVGKVVRLVREYQPQVMLTFDPTGGYGHPDHIAIHHTTREALRAAGDPSAYPEQLDDGLSPHNPDRLYYFCFPHSVIAEFQKAARGTEPQEEREEIDPESMGVPDEDVTTVLDVSAYADRKEKAARQHRTQISGDDPFHWVPEQLKQRLLSTEYLIRAHPPFVHSRDTPEDRIFSEETVESD